MGLEARFSKHLTRWLFGLGALMLTSLFISTAGAAGDLVVTPGSGLNSAGFTRGPFSESIQVYTIQNSSVASVVQWQVQKDQPWISFSETGGNLDPGTSVDVTVLINARALDLAVGTHTATITFWDFTSFASETRTVELDITLPGVGSTEVLPVVVTGRYAITLTGQPGTSFDLRDASGVAGPYASLQTGNFVSSTAQVEITADQGMRYYQATSNGSGAVPATLTMARVETLDNSIVRVTGEPNGTYIIEGSLNAIDYVAVYTNKVPASGEFTFTNTVFAPETPVDYRALPTGALSLPMLHHVLIAGESLALGFDGNPPLSTNLSPDNFRYRSTAQGRFFSPLSEVGLETIASGSASHIVSQAPLHRMITSNIGQGGAAYAQQKKGTPLYDLGVLQFAEAPQEVACHLFGYEPRAIFVVAGEGDQLSSTYGTDMRQWQTDYQKDIQFLSGFTGLIPMFHSQISGWTSISGGAYETVTSPNLILSESEANPSRTILVGPRYFLPYAQAAGGAQFPGVHLTNEGYRWLGEYYGKAYKRVVVDGGAWSPLRPTSITRSGNVITAVFQVPAPPLVLDTTRVTNPGNNGFEFTSGEAVPPTITGVSLVGANTVEILLSNVPTGGNERLRYAYTGIPGNSGGPTTGPRGNLRDSDATASLYGNDLFNWCVHFDKPVN